MFDCKKKVTVSETAADAMNTLLYSAVVLWAVSGVDSPSVQPRISITARVGSSAVLPCTWRDALIDSPHIEWRTFSETVLERSGKEQYQGEGYEGRVDVPEDKLKMGDCSLVLKDVRPDDAGVYESYLMVKRTKRSIQPKRVLIQSVELSVDDSSEEHFHQHTVPPTNDAGIRIPDPRISVLCLLLFFILYLL